MPSSRPIASKDGVLSGPRLRVLLVDQEPGRVAILETALHDAGYDVVSKLRDVSQLSEQVASFKPDVVIVDMDSPDRDCLESMAVLNRSNPCPVVMFSDNDDDSMIAKAIQVGVSAYVADGMSPERVKPVIQVAMARFREFQALRQELQRTKDELADRKVIEKAKGLLMKNRNFSEDEAYHAMRKLAMERGQRLAATAKSVIEVFELMGDGK